MNITIDTNEPLSDIDKQMLAVLSGVQAEAPAKAAPVAKKAASKAVAAKPEPTPEPEPEADEDLVGGSDDSDEAEPTMEDAVKIATELVSSGGSARVKAALAEVGAKKVSELKAKDIAAFVNTLSD